MKNWFFTIKKRMCAEKRLCAGDAAFFASSEALWERLSGFPLVGEQDKKELRAIIAASAALACAKKPAQKKEKPVQKVFL